MLQKFGFSQYESQVYEMMISAGQAVEASAIAKVSGVPKAKVYEVIARLLDKGVLLDSMLEKKKMYRALPLDRVIEKLTSQFQSDIEQLRLSEQKQFKPDDRVWNLATEESIYAYSLSLIESAKKTIYISTWKEIIEDYLPILEEKEKQGIHVEAHVVGEIDSKLKNLKYFVPSESQKELKKFQNIVVDDSEVVFAISKNPAWQSIITKSEQLVDVFRDFFYRDIILTLLSDKYNDILQNDAEYVDLLAKLRY
ncbi:TrmB family transcriptional regulator [Cohnella abietis]|uniref:Transcriptional regulator n=1 Tax=Cohnella abietis TaxID=2507935 RepID=A0A3T1CYA2_9BACL|nr:helix-turn-helix domain-containing protein [Cohnella abietis]BBI30842.1 transcriptional regulator [Cohnella abietis]